MIIFIVFCIRLINYNISTVLNQQINLNTNYNKYIYQHNFNHFRPMG